MQLTALPDGIGGCASLLRLGLKGNRLVALPPSIGDLSSLVELYLTGGEPRLLLLLHATAPQLKGVCPRGEHRRLQASALLSYLCNLLLHTADNLLESLPAEMGGMTSLVKLQVRWKGLHPSASHQLWAFHRWRGVPLPPSHGMHRLLPRGRCYHAVPRMRAPLVYKPFNRLETWLASYAELAALPCPQASFNRLKLTLTGISDCASLPRPS